MTVQQIRALSPRISEYLDEFADCFVTFDTRYHLKQYVQGQFSNLPRKSVEPIANLMDVPPRTLQEFLSWSQWDQDRLRDTLQRIVTRDHAETQAIAIIDESGHPKKGKKTACVQRQYCGASGKIDNCVMSVHLCYASFDGKFRSMLDSDLYLPKDGWDAERRDEAGIPDSVVYRAKHVMALDQLRHALANGMHFGWILADEWYGEKPSFIEGLEEMGQRFVLEIPKNLMGWVYPPKDAEVKRGEVQDLVRWSRPLLEQEWIAFHVKDTGMGAMVWEARAAPFWIKRGERAVGPYWLIATRDRLDQQTIKYFLSNASAGVPLEALLHVGFSRWPVERCLEDEKSELGLSHFEARKYEAVLRHLRITQVSHLFLARQTQHLAEKKPRGHDLPGAGRHLRVVRRAAAERGGSKSAAGQSRTDSTRDATEECRGSGIACQDSSNETDRTRHPPGESSLLHTAAWRVAL
jgi:SRSO17 transposase